MFGRKMETTFIEGSHSALSLRCQINWGRTFLENIEAKCEALNTELHFSLGFYFLNCVLVTFYQ